MSSSARRSTGVGTLDYSRRDLSVTGQPHQFTGVRVSDQKDTFNPAACMDYPRSHRGALQRIDADAANFACRASKHSVDRSNDLHRRFFDRAFITA